MSNANIAAFQAKVAASPDLQARLAEIRQSAATQVAESIARLSTETGNSFTADELLATAHSDTEIADQDLATVAGGGNVIVKKEHVSDSLYNLWGLLGNTYHYTTDDGETHRSGQHFEVGDTFTRPHRFRVR